jgi:hypothetical protein
MIILLVYLLVIIVSYYIFFVIWKKSPTQFTQNCQLSQWDNYSCKSDYSRKKSRFIIKHPSSNGKKCNSAIEISRNVPDCMKNQICMSIINDLQLSSIDIESIQSGTKSIKNIDPIKIKQMWNKYDCSSVYEDLDITNPFFYATASDTCPLFYVYDSLQNDEIMNLLQCPDKSKVNINIKTIDCNQYIITDSFIILEEYKGIGYISDQYIKLTVIPADLYGNKMKSAGGGQEDVLKMNMLKNINKSILLYYDLKCNKLCGIAYANDWLFPLGLNIKSFQKFGNSQGLVNCYKDFKPTGHTDQAFVLYDYCNTYNVEFAFTNQSGFRFVNESFINTSQDTTDVFLNTIKYRLNQIPFYYRLNQNIMSGFDPQTVHTYETYAMAQLEYVNFSDIQNNMGQIFIINKQFFTQPDLENYKHDDPVYIANITITDTNNNIVPRSTITIRGGQEINKDKPNSYYLFYEYLVIDLNKDVSLKSITLQVANENSPTFVSSLSNKVKIATYKISLYEGKYQQRILEELTNPTFPILSVIRATEPIIPIWSAKLYNYKDVTEEQFNWTFLFNL